MSKESASKMKYYISPPPMNPVSRLLAAIMAVLAVAAVVFFGLAVLIILVAGFSLFALVFYLRSWWFGRANGESGQGQTTSVHEGTVIDAEYTVVSRRRN